MSDKIYFTLERMEPKRYPEPRDIKKQLLFKMMNKYKGNPISSIDESTEFVLKSLKATESMPERPILKYRVLNIDWEDTRKITDVKFESRMFKWLNDAQNFEETGDYGRD
jgi:hypothetical protein